jgi:hypothetical protein
MRQFSGKMCVYLNFDILKGLKGMFKGSSRLITRYYRYFTPPRQRVVSCESVTVVALGTTTTLLVDGTTKRDEEFYEFELLRKANKTDKTGSFVRQTNDDVW